MPVEELERQHGIRDAIKLASNENPLGPSPRALAASTAALAGVGLYPDGSGFHLGRALARRLGVNPEQVTIGGSNDELVLLAEAFLGQRTDAVYSQYGFLVYGLAVQATGATPCLLYPLINSLKGPKYALTWPRWKNTLVVMIKLKDDISGAFSRMAASANP